MSDIKIVQVPRYERASPTWTEYFRLVWAFLFKLSPKQRVHVGAVFFSVSMIFGFTIMVAFDKVAQTVEAAPKYQMSLLTPASVTVAAVENTIFPVPEDSEFVPEEAPKPDKRLKEEKLPSKKNDTYPKAAKSIPPVSREAYIQKYAGYAKECMKKYGVPASISLAQGLVESNAGRSFLATEANNHFGMKCQSKCWGKGHCINRADDTHKDFFRKFRSAKESYDEHGKLISNGRYHKLLKHGKDYQAWARGLKKCGYATDATYARKLIDIIELHGLQKYDR